MVFAGRVRPLCLCVTQPDWWPPQRIARPNRRQLPPEPIAPRQEFLLLERLVDRHPDFVVDERFDQICKGPHPHRGHGPRHHAVIRDHQHDHVRIPRVNHPHRPHLPKAA